MLWAALVAAVTEHHRDRAGPTDVVTRHPPVLLGRAELGGDGPQDDLPALSAR